MDLGDPATQRRVGIAANAVGLLLLGVFLLFGTRAFGDPTLAWGTFLAGALFTAAGIALSRMATRG